MAKQASGIARAAVPVLLLAALFSGAASAQAQGDAAAAERAVQSALRRAIQDYPVLAAPAGQPLLTRIMDRQLALRAQGVAPGDAMAEAISDNLHALAPRQKQQAQVATRSR